MSEDDRPLPRQPAPAPAENAAEAPKPAGGPADHGRTARLDEIVDRLETLSAELESEPDPERADALVNEASGLAAEAGREVDAALEDSADPDGP